MLVLNRQEMYTEERKENMTSQVTQLHHQEFRQEQISQVSQETQEWQEKARREKHHVEYAESSHFSMVRQPLNIWRAFRKVYKPTHLESDQNKRSQKRVYFNANAGRFEASLTFEELPLQIN